MERERENGNDVLARMRGAKPQSFEGITHVDNEGGNFVCLSQSLWDQYWLQREQRESRRRSERGDDCSQSRSNVSQAGV